LPFWSKCDIILYIPDSSDAISLMIIEIQKYEEFFYLPSISIDEGLDFVIGHFGDETIWPRMIFIRTVGKQHLLGSNNLT
jgi:hypothetical protein